jgi:transcriptional regulator with XRE-family HTH domain
VHPTEAWSLMLATRLRELRETSWPGHVLTQHQLATAMSARKRVTVASISAWESTKNPVRPPLDRLQAYALFFATPRSIEDGVPRLVSEDDLTPDERDRMDDLLRELTGLREAARRPQPGDAESAPGLPTAGLATGPWFLRDREQITIVCAPLPPDLRRRMPYTDRRDPDYIELYTYADLDALLELHGHIRAANPFTDVFVRTASELAPDDYTSHLVLLGGVDWNTLTRAVLGRVGVPVRQVSLGKKDEPGYFEVLDGNDGRKFLPSLRRDGDDVELLEDVAHFFRGPNPFNRARTITICNGMFGRGVLGAVRTLTDRRFRDRNSAYVAEHFGDRASFSILARVPIVDGKVVTPDWTHPGARLHEWAEPDA